MPRHPLISVVIPAYNEEKYISACMTALKKQTFTDFEIIVVVQGTDKTATICRSFGCRVILQTTPSISLARATGCATAKGDIIACTDADTRPEINWLATIAAQLADPRVFAIAGPITFASAGFPGWLLSHYLLVLAYICRFFNYTVVYGNNFAITKAAYIQSGGFNPRLTIFEDMDLANRVSKLGQVKYCSFLNVLTSSRRLQRHGFLNFAYTQIRDNLTFILSGRANPNYEVIR